MVVLGSVRRQLQGGEHFAEEQPGTEGPADQVGVLARPADAGARRQGLLHHRRGVDAHLDLGLQLRVDPARHPPQALLQTIGRGSWRESVLPSLTVSVVAYYV